MPGTKKDDTYIPITQQQDSNVRKGEESGRTEYLARLQLDTLQPYPNNPFKPYTDKRLEVLTSSIRSEGVMEHIKVRPLEDGHYEILSGHNRVNASKAAGKETISAIVFEGLSDDEAIKIVTESNFLQRSLSDMSLSERVESVASHYEAANRQGCKQIKDNDSEDNETSGAMTQKYAARKITAEALGVGENFVKHSQRIVSELNDSLKNLVYNKKLAIKTAYTLSFLSEDEQRIVADVLASSNKRLEIKGAETLKRASEDKLFDRDTVEVLLSEGDKSELTSVPYIRVKSETLLRYFKPEQSQQEIEDELLKALEYYRSHTRPVVNDAGKITSDYHSIERERVST